MTPVKPIVRSLTLSPDMAGLAPARQLVIEVATEAGFSPERVFDISVVSSEATANAIEHACVKDTVEIRTSLYPDRLEVQVAGPGEFQAPNRLKQSTPRGLGLPLMAKLSDHLALYSRPDGGTLVTLTFYLPGADRDYGAEPLPPSVTDLIDSNELISSITENAPVGMYVLGPDLRFRWANHATRTFLDPAHRARDLTGLFFGEVVSGMQKAEFVAKLRSVSEDGTKDSGDEYELTGLERGTTYWRWEVLPLRGRDRTPPFDILGVAEDVTEQVHERRRADTLAREMKAERRRLETSEEGFRAFFEAMEDGFVVAEMVFDPEGKPIDYVFLQINQAYEKQSGLSSEAVIGKRATEFLETIGSAQIERCGAIVQSNEPQRFTEYLATHSRWLEVHAFPLPVKNRFGMILTDVTERKQAEERLRRSSETFAKLIENNPMGIYVVDSDFKIRNASLGARRAFRNVPPPLIGTPLDICLHTMWPEPFAGETIGHFRHTLDTGEPFAAPNRVVHRRDIEKVESYDWHLERIVLPDGRFGVVCYYYDLTAHQRWEKRLRESEERYRDLARENERLYRQQLKIAESLQLALLNIPSEMGPVHVGHLYRSATEAARVGGDFYDAFEINNRTIAVLVGDVSGHGIEAARTATLVKDVVHAFIHESLYPHQALRRTNALLLQKKLPGFVTLFLAILDTISGTLLYASAGHPETLLRRPSGEVLLLGTGSSPLGVYPDAVWKPAEIALDIGDLLLLYTDGVIEARRDGEFFGQQRLMNLLKSAPIGPEELPQMIINRVLAFSQGTLSDDVAVLALSLLEKGEKRGPASGR
ncbi:MAG: SpoIIE family protein phosphatase [Thermoleophilia bacterium]|jgi:PAS domain S-box-containing protein